MLEQVIRHVPLFAGLPPGEIAYLAETLCQREIPSQTLLTREGPASGVCYLVVEGQVEIIKALGTDGERLLGVRGPGTLIGEMSLFSAGGQHTASVRACAPLLVLEMTRGDFDGLLHRQPQLAYEMVRIYGRRLEDSENASIRELLEKNRQLKQAYEELKAAQAQIIEKEKLEAELEIARTIQASFLPRERPRLPGFDFGMLIQPAHSVGGDLFDFIRLGPDQLGIVIGDVTHHGVPAAIFMALTYSLLRAEAKRTASPGEALFNVNRHLIDLNTADMGVTVLYGIVDCTTGAFHYARAGHELPLLLDAAREPVEVRRSRGQPLGWFHDLVLDEHILPLPPGSLLLMYTDGVTEAVDAHRGLFGTEQLRLLAQASGGLPAQAVCEAIFQAVQTHTGDAPQHDDITLVAVRAE